MNKYCLIILTLLFLLNSCGVNENEDKESLIINNKSYEEYFNECLKFKLSKKIHSAYTLIDQIEKCSKNEEINHNKIIDLMISNNLSISIQDNSKPMFTLRN